MTFTIANILTLLRLVLAPVFVFFFVRGEQMPAFAVFCVAGFTDLIDGSVARILKQPSKGGALLDPLADKLLMQSCFTALVLVGLLPWWFYFLALIRDITIVAGIVYLARIKASLPYGPVWTSKFATLMQLAVAIAGLGRWWQPGFQIWGVGILTIEAWAVIAASVLIAVSGFQYVSMGIDILRNHKLIHHY